MQRKVSFFSGPGLRLSGVLDIPEGPAVRHPSVIICHGPNTGRTPSLMDYITPNVAAWLVKAGYAVLQFHCRGIMESEGPEYRLIPSEQVDDTMNAITYVQQQPEVDARRIGLWGSATGGAHASYVAGIDPRVQCIVSVSGMGDLGRWQRSMRRYWEWKEVLKKVEEDRVKRVLTGKSELLEVRQVIIQDPRTAQYSDELKTLFPDYRITERLISVESVQAMIQYRPETMVHRISPRAAMWICMAGDPLVPTEESESMFARAGEPKKLVVLEARRHHDLYHGAGFERMMGHSTAWFDEHLKNRL